GARVDAADTPQPRKVSQHKAQVSTRFALSTRKLRTTAPAGGPWLTATLFSHAPCRSGTVTPALAFGGGPRSVGARKYVLDVIVDQHNVEFTALVSLMLGQ